MPLWTPPSSDGVSNIGNTSGNTGVFSTGTQVLSGGNNITLSQATNASGATIGISGIPADSQGISTQGNTAGTTGFASASYQLVASNLLTASQSLNAGSATVTLIGPRVPGITRYDNAPVLGSASTGTYFGSLGTVNGSMHLFPISPGNDLFPGNMTALTFYLDMFGSGSSANSAAQTLRASLGVYTLAGASTLSLLNSGSASFTAAATSNQSTLWDGARYLTMNSSAFSASLTFSQTSYWLGVIFSSSAATQSLSIYGNYMGNQAQARSGTMGVSGTTNNSRDWAPWAGIVGTAALPASIHISGVTKTGASGGFVPHVIMEALHSAW